MKILSIATYDRDKQQTTVLYPVTPFYSLSGWMEYKDIQSLITQALADDKLTLNSPPLICHKNNREFHYMVLNNKKTSQILYFSVDEKLHYTANIIFDTIRNFLEMPGDINEFIDGLNEVHANNQLPKMNRWI